MPLPSNIHLVPLSSMLAEATSTTSIPIAVPGGTRAIEIVGATVKHYVKVNNSDTAGTVDETTAGIAQVDTPMVIYWHVDYTHLHIAAASATGTVDITFWG